jgi:hypothetical protein
VAVPEGGIGGIQVGLGEAGDAGVGETLFPLENGPGRRSRSWGQLGDLDSR